MENYQTPTNNQPTSENKLIVFIKRNRYIIFAFTMLIILFSILTSLVFISSNSSPDQNELVPPTTPKQVIQPTKQPTLIPPTVQPARYLTNQEKSVLVSQAKPQIDKVVAANYTVSVVKIYGDTWANIQIGGTQLDQAHVIVKKENGVWNLKQGPGTYIDEESLRAIGAPQTLIDEVNTNL